MKYFDPGESFYDNLHYIFRLTKVRPPIEFLNVGVTNPLITQLLLSDNFFYENLICRARSNLQI